MAIYRNIHTNFWEDSKVLDDMTIEERYFMLYLLTNPHTNQIGCYEISKRQMKNETDFDNQKINDLLKKFENELQLISYSPKTKEIFIKNWHKYNWSKSPKVRVCIEKEFFNVKDCKIKEILYKMLLKIYGIDKVSIQYNNGIYSLGIKEEKEQEKEEEQEEKKEKESVGSKVSENSNNISRPTSPTEIFNYCSILFDEYSKDDLDKSCKKMFRHYESKKWDGIYNWKMRAEEWVEEDIDKGKIKKYDTSRRLE